MAAGAAHPSPALPAVREARAFHGCGRRHPLGVGDVFPGGARRGPAFVRVSALLRFFLGVGRGGLLPREPPPPPVAAPGALTARTQRIASRPSPHQRAPSLSPAPSHGGRGWG